MILTYWELQTSSLTCRRRITFKRYITEVRYRRKDFTYFIESWKDLRLKDQLGLKKTTLKKRGNFVKGGWVGGGYFQDEVM